MVLGHGAPRDRRGVEGDPRRLHEGLEGRGTVRPPHAAAPDDQRTLGTGEERDGFGDGRGIAERTNGGCRGAGIHQVAVVDLLAEDVARHVEVDRTAASRRGLAERRGDHVGNALGRWSTVRPLRHRTRHAHLIDLLERLHVVVDQRARSAHGHQRSRVGVGVGDAGQEVRHPGPGTSHAETGTLQDPTIGVRHEGRRLLMAGIDGAHAELDQRGLCLEHGAAHDEEQCLDTLGSQRLGKNL